MLTEGALSKVNIDELLADGSYDNYGISKVLDKKQIKPNIKIRKDDKYKKVMTRVLHGEISQSNQQDKKWVKALYP